MERWNASLSGVVERTSGTEAFFFSHIIVYIIYIYIEKENSVGGAQCALWIIIYIYMYIYVAIIREALCAPPTLITPPTIPYNKLLELNFFLFI